MSHEQTANQPVPACGDAPAAGTGANPPRRRRWKRYVGVFGVCLAALFWWESRGPRTDEIEAEVKALGGAIETERMCPELIFKHLPSVLRVRVEPWRVVTGIDVHACEATDAHLARWRKLRHLNQLNLTSTQVTDAGLVHLSGLTNLYLIDLKSTQITDAGLVHLSGLRNLDILGLDSTQVSDAGMVHLKGLTKLFSLSLSSTRITDAGLVHLNGLTTLKCLDLEGTQVTAAAREKFQAQHPPCLIFCRQ